MVAVNRVKDIVESKADFAEVDIDTIERVGTTDEGDRFRVLETDADDEVDQVGFEITYPDGSPMAEQMFRDRVENYLRALSNRGDETDADGGSDADIEGGTEPAETADDDPSGTEDTAPSATSEADRRDDHADLSGSTPAVDTELSVTITEESIDALRAELDDVTTADRIDEIEGRLDDIETRLERVEGALDALASVSTDSGPLADETE